MDGPQLKSIFVAFCQKNANRDIREMSHPQLLTVPLNRVKAKTLQAAEGPPPHHTYKNGHGSFKCISPPNHVWRSPNLKDESKQMKIKIFVLYQTEAVKRSLISFRCQTANHPVWGRDKNRILKIDVGR